MKKFLARLQLSVLYILSLVLLFITISIIFNDFHSTPNTLKKGEIIDFSSNWEVSVGDSPFVLMDLPAKVSNPNNETITFKKTLPSNLDPSYNFAFVTSEQYVTVHYDNFLSYCYKYSSDTPLANLPGSIWHLITLRGGDPGESIIITLDSNFESYSGYIPSIYLGCRTSLFFEVILQVLFPFILGVTIIIVGLVLILLSLLLKVLKSEKLALFFGLFCIVCGIWVTSDSGMLQFFLGNAHLVDYFSYISFAALPCAFTLYLQQLYLYRKVRILKILSIVCMISLWMVFLLQITGIAYFPDTDIISQCLAAIVIFYTFVLEAKSFFVSKQFVHPVVTILGETSFLVCALFAYIAHYSNPNSCWKVTLVCIGMTIFICACIYDSAIKILTVKHLTRRNKFLEELAYVDVLTGLYNRTAYTETVIRKYNSNMTSFTNIAVFIADINDLKTINDTFGHEEGDIAISKAGQIIKQAFGGEGTAYRIGGDEFCIICENISREKCDKLLNKFRLETTNVNLATKKTSLAPIEVSLGFSFYDSREDKVFSLADLLKRADNAMYANKVKRIE